MIHVSELRIGNKFLSPFGKIETVLSIIDNTDNGKIKILLPEELGTSKIGYVSKEHRDQYSHLILCEENGNQYKPGEIKPVRLTEEWLNLFNLRCELISKTSYCTNDIKRTDKVYTDNIFDYEDTNTVNIDVIYNEDETELRRIGIRNIPILNNIEFVHDFQNTYFTLKKQELILTSKI